MPDTRNPAEYAVGDMTVTSLGDGSFTMPRAQFVTGASSNHADAIGDTLTIVVNAYLVRARDRAPILIDAGLGGGIVPTLGCLAAALAALDVSPEAIGTVLLTHLHGDHCGGLVDNAGRALFPNAELVVHHNELAYWIDNPATAAANAQGTQMAARALSPYAGRIRAIAGGDRVAPGIVAVPLPGHTPGHTGYRIADSAQSVLIWGDLVNVPGVQIPDPDAGVVTDVDGKLANATRRETLASLASSGEIVAGMHTEPAAFFTVERDGAGYRLAPAV